MIKMYIHRKEFDDIVGWQKVAGQWCENVKPFRGSVVFVVATSLTNTADLVDCCHSLSGGSSYELRIRNLKVVGSNNHAAPLVSLYILLYVILLALFILNQLLLLEAFSVCSIVFSKGSDSFMQDLARELLADPLESWWSCFHFFFSFGLLYNRPFWVAFCLCVKTSVRAKTFVQKCVSPGRYFHVD